MFCTLAAGLVLRERVDGGRWTATAVGFLGALAIVRPGMESVSLPMLAVLLSCAFYAGAWTSVKFLTTTEPASVIVFYMNLMMLPLTLIPSLFVWVTPGWEDLPVLLVMGISGWTEHFCQARAFAAADASAVMPFDFLRLPFTAGLGWLLFAEVMDVWTWIGAGVRSSPAPTSSPCAKRGRGEGRGRASEDPPHPDPLPGGERGGPGRRLLPLYLPPSRLREGPGEGGVSRDRMERGVPSC